MYFSAEYILYIFLIGKGAIFVSHPMSFLAPVHTLMSQLTQFNVYSDFNALFCIKGNVYNFVAKR